MHTRARINEFGDEPDCIAELDLDAKAEHLLNGGCDDCNDTDGKKIPFAIKVPSGNVHATWGNSDIPETQNSFCNKFCTGKLENLVDLRVTCKTCVKRLKALA